MNVPSPFPPRRQTWAETKCLPIQSGKPKRNVLMPWNIAQQNNGTNYTHDTSPEGSQAQTCTLHNSGDMAFSKHAKVTCNDRNQISGWVWVES